jgi:hypothetical protein
MTVMEPGEPVGIVEEEESVVVPLAKPSSIKTARDICASCRRPGIELDRGWVHLDARIDDPTNRAFCVFELYEAEPVAWGFLQTRGKSDFRVGPAPKSGGMAA